MQKNICLSPRITGLCGVMACDAAAVSHGSLFCGGERSHSICIEQQMTLLFTKPADLLNSPTKVKASIKFSISSNFIDHKLSLYSKLTLDVRSIYSIWISCKSWKAVKVAHGGFITWSVSSKARTCFKVHCCWAPQWPLADDLHSSIGVTRVLRYSHNNTPIVLHSQRWALLNSSH